MYLHIESATEVLTPCSRKHSIFNKQVPSCTHSDTNSIVSPHSKQSPPLTCVFTSLLGSPIRPLTYIRTAPCRVDKTDSLHDLGRRDTTRKSGWTIVGCTSVDDDETSSVQFPIPSPYRLLAASYGTLQPPTFLCNQKLWSACARSLPHTPPP